MPRRITPADAGKTSSPRAHSPRPRDHPRGCGENPRQTPLDAPAWGSPPRMRGKQRTVHSSRNRCRITPADAGKTARQHVDGAGDRDHPRGCGENSSDNVKCSFDLGSPPRMRGKPLYERFATASAGITPADAGKTLLLPLKLSACRDHPRGCGENLKKAS